MDAPPNVTAPAHYAQAPGTILLGATPIGHAGDASARFLTALAQADVVAAEDTRRLRGLAARLGVDIVGTVVSLHDHNEGQRAQVLIDKARGGARVLIVSDAGMPTVSDPGYRVVSQAVAAGVVVSALPGPSAPVTALAVSGLPSDRFTFEGFLPRKEGEARRHLEGVANLPHTLIFFESPRRIHDTLVLVGQVLGSQRRAVVCRELTKTHEEILRGTVAELVELTGGEVLGEITFLVEGRREVAQAADHVEAVLALAAEGMRLKEAAAEVAAVTGARKNDLYKEALRRKAP